MSLVQGFPLRLCGDAEIEGPVCTVVLVRVEAEQFHLGLGRCDESHEPVLHLAWHRILREQGLEEIVRGVDGTKPSAVVAVGLDPSLSEALQALMRLVAARYGREHQGPAYGVGETSAAFQSGTGEVSDPDAAFTCASFVLAMLKSVGVTLIDASRWPPASDEDRRWQQAIGEKLIAWIEKHIHGDLPRAHQRLIEDLDARRFHPTDVAGAALFGPDEWPVDAARIRPRARLLGTRLAWRRP